MNELMEFKGNNVEVLVLDGKAHFNPYHIGVCLELAESSIRDRLRKMNSNQVIKLKNSNVAETNIRKLNNAGENFLTESGVYKLVFRSKKPEAVEFENWITDEVLPELRATGGYQLDNPSYQIDNDIERAKAWIEEQKERKALEESKEKYKKDSNILHRVKDYAGHRASSPEDKAISLDEMVVWLNSHFDDKPFTKDILITSLEGEIFKKTSRGVPYSHHQGKWFTYWEEDKPFRIRPEYFLKFYDKIIAYGGRNDNPHRDLIFRLKDKEIKLD